MDKTTKHVAPLKRIFGGFPRVGSLGYMPNKTGWVNGAFQAANFSFIISGKGYYTCIDGEWPIIAPCVITQWPGPKFYYGPEGSWEELYFCYPVECYKYFLENGFMSEFRRWWPISNLDAFYKGFAHLELIFENLTKPGQADRLDFQVLQLIMETLFIANPQMNATERVINSSKNFLEEHFTEDHNYDDIALDFEMSPSSFRRHWKSYVGMTPKQFVTQLRIQKAMCFLIETDLSIQKISYLAGFKDSLYFSRKFRQIARMCPSDYRDTYRIP